MTNNQSLESRLVIQRSHIIVDELRHCVFVKRVKCCAAKFFGDFRPQLPQKIEIRLTIAMVLVMRQIHQVLLVQ